LPEPLLRLPLDLHSTDLVQTSVRREIGKKTSRVEVIDHSRFASPPLDGLLTGVEALRCVEV
jgi:hypothetical protein